MVDEMGVVELRAKLADVLNAAVRGEITYVTTRGRRIAAIVPLGVAMEEEAAREGDLEHMIKRLQNAGYIVKHKDDA